MMRTLPLALAALLIPTIAAAQTPAPPPPSAPPPSAPPPSAPPMQPAPALERMPPLAPNAMPAPPGYYMPALRYKTHSPALMAGGIVLASLGLVSVGGGISAIIEDQNSHGDFRGFLTVLMGIPLLIHGAGCIAGGIPMIVIGNRQIPAGYAGAPSLVPTVAPGPKTTLTWTF